jgi:hypothetical protein
MMMKPLAKKNGSECDGEGDDMNRDVATRLDGMLMAARGGLNGIAHYMRENLKTTIPN